MKKTLTIISLAILFTSCNKVGLRKDKTNNKDYEIEYLFEHNGIKMYRFYDRTRYHYFTNKGETITSQTSSKTTYEENIN